MDTLVSVFTSVHALNFIGEKLDPIRHPGVRGHGRRRADLHRRGASLGDDVPGIA